MSNTTEMNLLQVYKDAVNTYGKGHPWTASMTTQRMKFNLKSDRFAYAVRYRYDSVASYKQYLEYTKVDGVIRGKDIAKLKAAANKHHSVQFTERDSTAWTDVLSYLMRLFNGSSTLLMEVEPAQYEAMEKCGNGWDEVKLNKLHPLHNNCRTTEDTAEFDAFKMAHHWLNRLHMIHISEEVPTQIAYYPTLRALRTNKPVRTSIGKYLTKYSSAFKLSEAAIKDMAEKFMAQVNARSGWTVKFIEHNDPAGWERIYDSGVRSCMKGTSSVRVYAHEKSVLRLAYLEDGAGDVIARCIVRDDDEKGWLRVYPDHNGYSEGRFLLDHLRAVGYADEINLDGVLLKVIDANNGYVCPYLDCGNDGTQNVQLVRRDGEEYLLVDSNGDMEATNADGYVNAGRQCDECGDTFCEDDMNWMESSEETVCNYCRDQHYTYAYGRNGYREYFPNDEVIEADGDYYHQDYLSENDVHLCDVTDEYHHSNNMMFFDEGAVHEAAAAHVDHEHDGSNYIYPTSLHTLSDGTTCHEDDADDLEQEIADEDDAEFDVVFDAINTDAEETPTEKKPSVIAVGDTVWVVRTGGSNIYSIGDRAKVVQLDTDGTVYLNFNDMGNRRVTGDGYWWVYLDKVVRDDERVTQDKPTNVDMSEIYILAA